MGSLGATRVCVMRMRLEYSPVKDYRLHRVENPRVTLHWLSVGVEDVSEDAGPGPASPIDACIRRLHTWQRADLQPILARTPGCQP